MTSIAFLTVHQFINININSDQLNIFGLTFAFLHDTNYLYLYTIGFWLTYRLTSSVPLLITYRLSIVNGAQTVKLIFAP